MAGGFGIGGGGGAVIGRMSYIVSANDTASRVILKSSKLVRQQTKEVEALTKKQSAALQNLAANFKRLSTQTNAAYSNVQKGSRSFVDLRERLKKTQEPLSKVGTSISGLGFALGGMTGQAGQAATAVANLGGVLGATGVFGAAAAVAGIAIAKLTQHFIEAQDEADKLADKLWNNQVGALNAVVDAIQSVNKELAEMGKPAILLRVEKAVADEDRIKRGLDAAQKKLDREQRALDLLEAEAAARKALGRSQTEQYKDAKLARDEARVAVNQYNAQLVGTQKLQEKLVALSETDADAARDKWQISKNTNDALKTSVDLNKQLANSWNSFFKVIADTASEMKRIADATFEASVHAEKWRRSAQGVGPAVTGVPLGGLTRTGGDEQARARLAAIRAQKARTAGGGQDLGAQIGGLAGMGDLGGQVGAALAMGDTAAAGTAITGAIASAAALAAPAAGAAVATAFGAIIASPFLLTGALIGDTITQGILGTLEQLPTAISEAILSESADHAATAITKFFDSALNKFARMSGNIRAVMEVVVSGLPLLIEQMAVTIADVLTAVLERSPDVINALIAGLTRAFSAIMDKMPQLLEAAIPALFQGIVLGIQAGLLLLGSWPIGAAFAGVLAGALIDAIRKTDFQRVIFPAIERIWHDTWAAVINAVSTPLNDWIDLFNNAFDQNIPKIPQIGLWGVNAFQHGGFAVGSKAEAVAGGVEGGPTSPTYGPRADLPTFHQGGFVSRLIQSMAGRRNGGDEVVARLQAGEVVVSKQDVASAGGPRETMERVRHGSGGGAPTSIVFFTEEAAREFVRNYVMPEIRKSGQLGFATASGWRFDE